MPRDFNDIIPPSRRKRMGLEEGMNMDQAPAPIRMDEMQAPLRQPEELPVRTIEPELPEWKQPRKTLPKVGLRFSFPFGTVLLAVAVLAGCAAVLYAFSGAKVVITPVTSPATVTTELTAYRDSGDLTFQQITVEKNATMEVASEGTAEAHDSATGSIVIHNAGSAAQPLIKNTRFETPDGLIFRVHESVVVPAGGDFKATVYADEAGEKYNIPATTFTVPGLKGSKSFTLITATSNAPMTGGFVGTRASVNEETRQKTYSALQAELTTALQKDLAAKVPEGFVLVPGTSFPTYEPAADVQKDSSTVTVAEKGVITAVVFPEEALARAVAFKSIGTYDGSPVRFESVSGLSVAPKENGIAPDATEFSFTISGNATIVWKIDENKIAGAVAGKSRGSAEIALKSFLEVDRATLVLRPFWASTFPTDPSKISVTLAGDAPAAK